MSTYKQLVLPIESFLLLAALAEQDENDILAKLNAKLAEESAGIAVIEKKNLKERFMNAISDPVAFVRSLMSIYSAGRPIIEAVLRIIS